MIKAQCIVMSWFMNIVRKLVNHSENKQLYIDFITLMDIPKGLNNWYKKKSKRKMTMASGVYSVVKTISPTEYMYTFSFLH